MATDYRESARVDAIMLTEAPKSGMDATSLLEDFVRYFSRTL